jgi:hypothetical protein
MPPGQRRRVVGANTSLQVHIEKVVGTVVLDMFLFFRMRRGGRDAGKRPSVWLAIQL